MIINRVQSSTFVACIVNDQKQRCHESLFEKHLSGPWHCRTKADSFRYTQFVVMRVFPRFKYNLNILYIFGISQQLLVGGLCSDIIDNRGLMMIIFVSCWH